MTSARLTADTTRTYSLEGGASASTFVGIGIALVVEGIALHVWIAGRSQLWAWTVTALNAATLIWLWRAYKAQARSALLIDESDVEVTLGTSFRVRFARSSITTVDAVMWRSVPDVAPDYVNAAKPLEPNVTIRLGTPVHAKLPLGLTKRVSRIDLRVADAASVIDALRPEVPTASGQIQR